MNELFKPMAHPYKWVKLHQNIEDKNKFSIETEYGQTNYFVYYSDLFDYIRVRLAENTKVEIIPTKD